MNFAVETNFANYTLAAQGTTVVVHFEAPPANAERAPVDIVLVSDVSGSMFGPKMDLLKQASRMLVKETTAKDRVGLVEFSTAARTSSDLKHMDEVGKRDVSACIERMISDGGTNLSAGLFMGVQQLVDAPSEQRVRAVLLMTDGRANEGLVYLKEILHVLNGLLANTGITIHAFGYGADHDSTLLRGVMNGSFYFVEGVDDLRGSFGDCLGGLLSVVAQNIEVTLEGVNGATIKQVHHKNAEKLVDGRVRVPFSDVYGDEQRDLVIDVALPEGSADVVVKATLSYVDVVNARAATMSTDVAVKRLEKVEDPTPNPKVELQVARLRVARSLDRARQAAEKSDMVQARGLLVKEKEELGLLRKRTGDVAMLDDFDADVERGLLGLQNEASFKSARHEMASASEAHEQQRAMSSGPELVRQTTYQTKSKEAMSAKFSEPANFKP